MTAGNFSQTPSCFFSSWFNSWILINMKWLEDCDKKYIQLLFQIWVILGWNWSLLGSFGIPRVAHEFLFKLSVRGNLLSYTISCYFLTLSQPQIFTVVWKFLLISLLFSFFFYRIFCDDLLTTFTNRLITSREGS